MALTDLILYCDRAGVEHVLSQVGLSLALDDDRDGAVSATENYRLADALAEATEDVNLYCWQKYSPQALSRSNWVARKANVLAACYVRAGRGNSVPDSLVDRCEKIMEELARVQEGSLLLPNVPLRHRLAPKMSNVRVNPRFDFRAIRKERGQSTRDTEGLPQQYDLREQFTIEP